MSRGFFFPKKNKVGKTCLFPVYLHCLLFIKILDQKYLKVFEILDVFISESVRKKLEGVIFDSALFCIFKNFEQYSVIEVYSCFILVHFRNKTDLKCFLQLFLWMSRLV